MSSRAILTVGIAAVVLLSSSVVVATIAGPAAGEPNPQTQMNAQEQPTDPLASGTIEVTASAERTASPDAATIRLAVIARADSADAAREGVAENASRMRAALREAGVDDDAVRTTYYDLGEEYERTENGSRVAGYRAAQGFAVEVVADDLGNRTGAILDAAVGNGATRVDGVQFTLSEETRRDLRQEALGAAMANADRDASTLADAANRTIAGVYSVSTVDADVRPVRADVQFEAATEGTSFEPGPVTVSATVSVTYRLD